jgi:hypothetical protein
VQPVEQLGWPILPHWTQRPFSTASPSSQLSPGHGTPLSWPQAMQVPPALKALLVWHSSLGFLQEDVAC